MKEKVYAICKQCGWLTKPNRTKCPNCKGKALIEAKLFERIQPLNRVRKKINKKKQEGKRMSVKQALLANQDIICLAMLAVVFGLTIVGYKEVALLVLSALMSKLGIESVQARRQ